MEICSINTDSKVHLLRVFPSLFTYHFIILDYKERRYIMAGSEVAGFKQHQNLGEQAAQQGIQGLALARSHVSTEIVIKRRGWM